MGGDDEKPGICLVSYESDPKNVLGHTGGSIRLSYNVSESGSFSYYFVVLGRRGTIKELNLSKFKYLSFWIKGLSGGENFKIELHQDVNDDGRFTYGKDIVSSVYIDKYLKAGVTKNWQKIIIPLKDFLVIRDMSKVCEMVFTFEENKADVKKSEIFIDDLLIGRQDIDTNIKKIPPDKATFKADGDLIRNNYLFNRHSILEIEANPDIYEVVWFEMSRDNGRSWHRIAAAYNPNGKIFASKCGMDNFCDKKDLWLRAVSVTPLGQVVSMSLCVVGCSVIPYTCFDLLDDLQKQSFLYFLENQNRKTGLFRDTGSSKDSSTAVTGFGLVAMCIGAERGWISKDEAKRRVLLVMDTFTKDRKKKTCDDKPKKQLNKKTDKEKSSLLENIFDLERAGEFINSVVAVIKKPVKDIFSKTGEKKLSAKEIKKGKPPEIEDKDGFYYHFIKSDTGKRSGNSEISTIDTTLLLCGMIIAGDYFGGRIKKLAEKIYRGIDWMAFCDERYGGKSMFLMGWTPEKGYLTGRWDFFSDETILVTLLAAASPSYNVPSKVYYDWVRQVGNYGGGRSFIYSWYGALFTHQYANLFFDFRDLKDRNQTNWFQNSKAATLANRKFCMDEAGNYKTYKPNCWGITSVYTPKSYTMKYGTLPNGDNCPMHDGTVSPLGAGTSISFTPFYSVSAIQYMLQKYPKIKGRYGLVNSFNLQDVFYAPTDYGLDTGAFLLALENFRSGFVWKYFMENKHIKNALNKTGFKKDSRYVKSKADIKGICAFIERFLSRKNPDIDTVKGMFSGMEELVNAGDEEAFKLFIQYNNHVYKKILKWLDRQKYRLDTIETEYLKFLALIRLYQFDKTETQFDNFIKALNNSGSREECYKNLKYYIKRIMSLNILEDYTDKLCNMYFSLAEGLKGCDIESDIKGFADCSFKSGKYSQAYKFYNKCLNGMKKKLNTGEFTGLCSRISNKYFNIERYDYSSSIDLLHIDYLLSKKTQDAANIDYILLLINRYYELERYSTVVNLVDRFLKYYPDNEAIVYVLLMRGMCGRKMKKYDHAIEDFKTIADSDADSEILGRALLMLGEIYMVNGKNKRALDYFNSVIEKSPDSEMADTALYNKGIILYSDNNLSDAEKIFKHIAGNEGNYKYGAEKYLEKINSKKGVTDIGK